MESILDLKIGDLFTFNEHEWVVIAIPEKDWRRLLIGRRMTEEGHLERCHIQVEKMDTNEKENKKQT